MERENLTPQQLKALFINTKTISLNKRGEPKVAISKDGQQIIKCFSYREKDLYRQQINPVATEFVKNAYELLDRNVNTLKPLAWYRCAAESYDVVIYDVLPGRTVKQILDQDNDFSILNKLIVYIVKLHERGIYFKAGHLDNYLYQSDGSFALIDIDNLRFALSLRRRVRNLIFLYSHTIENSHSYFQHYDFMQLVNQYIKEAKFSRIRRAFFYCWFKYYWHKMVYKAKEKAIARAARVR